MITYQVCGQLLHTEVVYGTNNADGMGLANVPNLLIQVYVQCAYIYAHTYNYTNEVRERAKELTAERQERRSIS